MDHVDIGFAIGFLGFVGLIVAMVMQQVQIRRLEEWRREHEQLRLSRLTETEPGTRRSTMRPPAMQSNVDFEDFIRNGDPARPLNVTPFKRPKKGG